MSSRGQVTLDDLLDMINVFKKSPPNKPIKIANSIEVWKQYRKTGFCYAQWTDSELDNFNKDTGVIGTKCGIECYVLNDLNDYLNNQQH